jgi:hypothetical protein
VKNCGIGFADEILKTAWASVFAALRHDKRAHPAKRVFYDFLQ